VRFSLLALYLSSSGSEPDVVLTYLVLLCACLLVCLLVGGNAVILAEMEHTQPLNATYLETHFLKGERDNDSLPRLGHLLWFCLAELNATPDQQVGAI